MKRVSWKWRVCWWRACVCVKPTGCMAAETFHSVTSKHGMYSGVDLCCRAGADDSHTCWAAALTPKAFCISSNKDIFLYSQSFLKFITDQNCEPCFPEACLWTSAWGTRHARIVVATMCALQHGRQAWGVKQHSDVAGMQKMLQHVHTAYASDVTASFMNYINRALGVCVTKQVWDKPPFAWMQRIFLIDATAVAVVQHHMLCFVETRRMPYIPSSSRAVQWI